MNVPGGNDSFVLLGVVSRPHGLRGELKIRTVTEHPGNLSRYRRVYLAGTEGQSLLECTNFEVRVSGETVILKLQECSSRERAEKLVGHRLLLAESDLPPLDGDAFYLNSLEGKRAMTTTGQALGTIKGFLRSSQDVLIIVDGDHEYLVPAVRAFVAEVRTGEVVLDLPPGLLEINR